MHDVMALAVNTRKINKIHIYTYIFIMPRYVAQCRHTVVMYYIKNITCNHNPGQRMFPSAIAREIDSGWMF